MNQLNELSKRCHNANITWWLDLRKPCPICTGQPEIQSQGCLTCKGHGYLEKVRNVGELLMLCVSEVAEADEGMIDNPERAMLLMSLVRTLSRTMEGHRKDLMDDKLPHRKMFEVELVDLLIRVFDLAGGYNLDLAGAFEEKMEYNARRQDHKIETRLQPGGKAY